MDSPENNSNAPKIIELPKGDGYDYVEYYDNDLGLVRWRERRK